MFNRAALAHFALTGISSEHLGSLIIELVDPWTQQREGRLRDRRGADRRRQAGAGRKHKLVFTDRVIITLIYLRLDLPQVVLGVLFNVDQATVCRAIRQVRPLLAGRGHAVAGRPGVRLKTLADVIAYAAAEGVTLRLDATETQVRRPQPHRVGRRAFVSGKKRLNTIKTTVINDSGGRTLWAGAIRPGRMHDQTATQVEGIDALLPVYPTVRILADAGYRGLRRDHKGQVIVPPPRPGKKTQVDPHTTEIRAKARKRQSSQHIPAEHAIAAHKTWRGLCRWHHHRNALPETYLAVTGLVSDRDALR
ncbi:MAG: transposase [Longispora sp.]|nr:transposase [Longispora sp. (in: high G+C Gram-positive bacteria)]